MNEQKSGMTSLKHGSLKSRHEPHNWDPDSQHLIVHYISHQPANFHTKKYNKTNEIVMNSLFKKFSLDR